MANAPNIKFIGKHLTQKVGKIIKIRKRFDPIELIIDAGVHIALPKAEKQKGTGSTFFHKHAADIVRLAPHLYKLLKK